MTEKPLTQEEKIQNLVNLVLSEEKKGNVVLSTFEGLAIANLSDLVDKQPIEGILYDLNRLPETVLTFINDPKWVNDYAVSLVIKKLHNERATLQAELRLTREALAAANIYILHAEMFIQVSTGKVVDEILKEREQYEAALSRVAEMRGEGV